MRAATIATFVNSKLIKFIIELYENLSRLIDIIGAPSTQPYDRACVPNNGMIFFLL